jgi:hypothetical protein
MNSTNPMNPTNYGSFDPELRTAYRELRTDFLSQHVLR